MHASFVTLGQLFKFAFDTTGILPRMRSKKDGLSYSDVRRLSKQIERLVKEEGDINANSGELIKSLAFELTGTIPNVKVNMATIVFLQYVTIWIKQKSSFTLANFLKH